MPLRYSRKLIKHKMYTCYLREDTSLDMMYMPDAVRAMIELMEADPEKLAHRNAFNVTSMNFTPAKLAGEIKKHIPEFEMEYNVDLARQEIADSWPNSINDSAARNEWGWKPNFDIETMTSDMLDKLSRRTMLPSEQKTR